MNPSCLLDTHIFLWWRAADRRLSKNMRMFIARADRVYVSAATGWECSIKAQLGKLTIPQTVAEGIAASGFVELPISIAHAERAGKLPMHHRDPFDRMLVAQAELEGLPLVSVDRKLANYGVVVFAG
ncbi:MAG TPA: type II toxin-antitoxin system VapC family toxin [Kofleriaceae bacterium]|nr:type II toxin-antitoxin system VapC family toxin [Kofleriaceae bacterium]